MPRSRAHKPHGTHHTLSPFACRLVQPEGALGSQQGFLELRDPLRLPSLSLSTWHWYDGQAWVPRPAMKCSEVDPEQPQLSTPQLPTPATGLPPPTRLPDPAAVTPPRRAGVPLEPDAGGPEGAVTPLLASAALASDAPGSGAAAPTEAPAAASSSGGGGCACCCLVFFVAVGGASALALRPTGQPPPWSSGFRPPLRAANPHDGWYPRMPPVPPALPPPQPPPPPPPARPEECARACLRLTCGARDPTPHPLVCLQADGRALPAHDGLGASSSTPPPPLTGAYEPILTCGLSRRLDCGPLAPPP